MSARIVLFASAFRGEAAPNITHVALGEKTLCGRRGWETDEGSPEKEYEGWEPDCLVCRPAWKKRRSG